MGFTQLPKNGEDDSPQSNEEPEYEQGDTPVWRVLRTPQVFPVAAIGSGQEVILQDDSDEEPGDNLATEQGFVEVWSLSRTLAIVWR